MGNRWVWFILAFFFTGSLGLVRADLVGHWRLDEGGGTVAYDSSGNGNDGNLVGSPEWVAGYIGGALEFSSADSFVDIPYVPEMTPPDGATISAWVFPKDSTRSCIAGQFEGYGMALMTGLQLKSVYWGGDWVLTDVTIPEQEWSHLAMTWDVANNKRQIFLNGVMVGEQGDAVIPAVQNNFGIGLWVGWPSSWGDDSFMGVIDDVRLHSHVLTEAEILATMSTEPLVAAHAPKPNDGEMIVPTSPALQWRAGEFAAGHEVYVGADADAVAAATPEDADLFAGRLGMTMLPVGVPGGPFPEGLVPGTTYYWRVDEVNDTNPDSPWKGNVWSFWVQPVIAYKPFPADGMKYIDPDQDLTWKAGTGTLFHTVYFGQTFEEVDGAVAGGWMTVAATYDPGTLELDTTYYWRVDEFTGLAANRAEIWSFTTRGEGGGAEAEYFDGMDLAGDPILAQIEPSINHNWSGEVAGGLEDLVSARWRANLEAPFTEPVKLITTSDDGVRLYVDGRLVIENWTDHSSTDNTATIDMVAGQVYLIVMEWYENDGGAVAQLSWESDTLPRQIIPQGWLQLPLKATSPSPANGTPHVDQNWILSWTAGDDATGHQVYFGDDAGAVANADTSTAKIYRGQQAAGVTTYNPGPLEWGKTYYWRVDEVNPDGVLAGVLWSFTAADFIIIDDFESYDNEVGSRPFEVWIDGYGFSQPPPGNPGNGSNAAVGHDIWSPGSRYYNGLLMETQKVHGGFQSMPVDYNNVISPFYSEIERTWAAPQNWTVNGVDTLTMYVRGASANGPDRFYVTLSDSTAGSATVAFADAEVLTSIAWTEVKIPLSDFAGVNAAAITKMIVGVGNPPAAGGAGTLLFDDFRVTKTP